MRILFCSQNICLHSHHGRLDLPKAFMVQPYHSDAEVLNYKERYETMTTGFNPAPNYFPNAENHILLNNSTPDFHLRSPSDLRNNFRRQVLWPLVSSTQQQLADWLFASQRPLRFPFRSLLGWACYPAVAAAARFFAAAAPPVCLRHTLPAGKKRAPTWDLQINGPHVRYRAHCLRKNADVSCQWCWGKHLERWCSSEAVQESCRILEIETSTSGSKKHRSVLCIWGVLGGNGGGGGGDINTFAFHGKDFGQEAFSATSTISTTHEFYKARPGTASPAAVIAAVGAEAAAEVEQVPSLGLL